MVSNDKSFALCQIQFLSEHCRIIYFFINKHLVICGTKVNCNQLFNKIIIVNFC